MAVIPIIIGLGALGVMAFAAGGKRALAATPATPPTHRPKKRAPTVSPTSEQAVIAAMNDPAKVKAIVEKALASGDPVAVWNLGRTMLLNSKGKPMMQAAASSVMAQAVVMAAKQGELGKLTAVALANGDAGLLSQAAKSAATLAPSMATQFQQLASQLTRAGQPPAGPSVTASSPGLTQPTNSDDAFSQKAAAAASQVMADAIKQTEQVMRDPPGAPVPTTVLPEVVITPGETSPQKAAALQLTGYLEDLSAGLKYPHMARFKENKAKVGRLQAKIGVSADGSYGPGTASAVGRLGVVPVPPFYWTKSKWQAQKRDYKNLIASLAGQFPDKDWAPALRGVDVS